MEIELLKRKNEYIRFILKGVTFVLANALRRTIISEVPTMAIEDVVIVENSSLMYDEILSHRLGLIPLTTDLDSYILPEECDCSSELGCNKCRASFTLEASATDETITLYSDALNPKDPMIQPVSDKIPLVKLAPGEKIKLEAYAKLGKGKDHAKWQPVSLCTYKNMPKITIDSKKCGKCDECIKYCPPRILKKINKKIVVENILDCKLCKECMTHCPKKESPITIAWDDHTFIFNIESTGSLPVEKIVIEAIHILQKKIQDFETLLKQI